MTGTHTRCQLPMRLHWGAWHLPALRGGLKTRSGSSPLGCCPRPAGPAGPPCLRTTLLLAVSSRDWITFSLCLNRICSMSSARRLPNFCWPKVTP